jgi:O-antigen/teichoic acid export membrane protein
MSMKRRATRGVIWAAAGSWGREAAGFAVFLILARLLGPEAYGLVAMATVVIAVAQLLVADVIQEPLIQRENLEPGHLDAAFWSLLALAVTVMLAAMAAAEPVAALFDEPEVARLIWSLSGLPVLNALVAVPTALLRREMRYGVLAARALLGVIGGGAVGIGMALTGQGALSLVGHLLTQEIVAVLVLWLAIDWRPRWRHARRHFRDLRVPGTYMIGVRLVLLVQQQSPRVLIGYFLGPVALGLYGASWRIVEILYLLLIRPLSDVALPAFAHLQDDMERFRQVLYAARRLGAVIAMPTFVGLALVAPELLPAAFGGQWNGAIPVVQLLAIGGVCWSFLPIAGIVPQALGRWGVTLATRALATVVIVAAILVVREAGLLVIAAAVAAGEALMVVVNFYVVRRLTATPMSEQALAYAPILSAALIMAAAVLGWRELMIGDLTRLSLLATSVLGGAAVYSAALCVMAFPLARQAWELLSGLKRTHGLLAATAASEGFSSAGASSARRDRAPRAEPMH